MKMVPSVTAVPVLLLLLLLVLVAAPTPSDEEAAAAAAPTASDEAVASAPTVSDEVEAIDDKKKKDWTMPGDSKSYHAASATYVQLANDMKGLITGSGERKLEKHPVLFRQVPRSKPPYWLFRTLHGRPLKRAQIAIRTDNLYLSGFANGAGQWFKFKTDQYNSFQIPDSITLPFGNSYEELVGSKDNVGGAWKNLEGLDLKRESILDAIDILGDCNPKTTPVQDLKLALAKLVVFLCEAQRFQHIWDLVNSAFYETDKDKGLLDHRGAQLVVQWKRISCAILIWNMDQTRWDSTEAQQLAVPYPDGPGIGNAGEALAAIWPILQVAPLSCSVPYVLAG